MNISEPFINKPVATSLLMLAIAFFGMVSYFQLPVNELPIVDFPTIQVSASVPGADPDTMASAVATPLERQFSTIAGLDSINSSNSPGATQIALQFDLSRNIDAAAQDVQSAINSASRLLPPGMPNPPTIQKVNPAEGSILSLDLVSSTLPLWQVNEYTERMAERISMIKDVAQAQVTANLKYSVHVQLDPQLLASRQIGINEVENALRQWNVNLPAGNLDGRYKAFTIKASGQLMNASGYRSLVVAYRNGSPVLLEDLGDVIEDVQDKRSGAWYGSPDGYQKTAGMLVQRQPGTNTVEVVDRILQLLPTLAAEMPPSIKLNVAGNHSETIRGSFNDVQFTMMLTLGLVIMVIFLFLRNVLATAIPSLALPFSIIGTFAAMYLFGFSLNNLSMMALILSIGFVVDDAIVMLENIVRHMELGEERLEAVFNGSKEIEFTIVSMTLSLAAVFIPVLFMGGILGRLFREFAVTICAAILISGVVSLTLTPMLCSRLLRAPSEQRHGRFYQVTERFFEGMFRVYDRTLQWVLRHRPGALVVSGVILALTVYLFVKIPKGFMPDEDTNELRAYVEAPQGTSYTEMVRYQTTIAEIVRHDPNVRSFTSNLRNGNTGNLNIHLVPRSQRKLSVNQIVEQWRPELGKFPGVRVFLQIPPAITLGTQQGKSLYQFTLQSMDTEELYRESQKFEQEMARLPAVQDVTSDLLIKNPEVHVTIDRDKTAALKLTPQDIENALNDSFGSHWVSTIYAPSNEYQVLLELKPEYQSDPASLALLYVKSSNGNLVPLSTVAQITETVGAQTIQHFGQLPAVTVSFNLRPGNALGEAVSQIQSLAARTLPASVSTTFQGSARTFQSSLKNLWILLIMAIVVVYIILGILYESYIHPLTILSGLPSAGFGALLTLLIFHVDLNIYGFVGIIMLIGIVKKNAIMQVDFALEAQRKEGKSPMEAVYQGCLIRFRPIMMTTMAALLAGIPIALGYGQGGEARRPLGLTVVGGLLFSQLITLYLTPVVYIYMAKLQAKFPATRRQKKGQRVPALSQAS